MPNDDNHAFQLLCKTLDRIEKSIEQLDERNVDAHKQIITGMGLINGRVRKLEHWRSGICAVGGFIVLLWGGFKTFWRA